MPRRLPAAALLLPLVLPLVLPSLALGVTANPDPGGLPGQDKLQSS